LCFIYEFQKFLMFMVDAYFLSTVAFISLSLDATSMYIIHIAIFTEDRTL